LTIIASPFLFAAISITAAPLPTPADGYFQEVRKVTEHVWVLAQPKFQVQPIGNVTVIEQSDGLVLVDSGGSPGAGRRVVERVRSLSKKPVKAVVVTHWHGDHPLGISEILKAWPRARTIATSATQEHLRTPKTMNTSAVPDPARNETLQQQFRGYADYSRKMAGEAKTDEGKAGWAGAERLFNQYVRDMDGALTLTTAEAFADRLAIPDSKVPLEAIFLGRANTDGDALVWLPKQRVLVTGDVVVAPIPFGFNSYPADWIGVLEKVKAYDFRVLIPGHGLPQTDRRYLDALITLLRAVRAQVGALVEKGLALEQVREQVDLSAQATAFAGKDAWLRQWFDAYWTQAIVVAAFREAKGEPIVQSLN